MMIQEITLKDKFVNHYQTTPPHHAHAGGARHVGHTVPHNDRAHHLAHLHNVPAGGARHAPPSLAHHGRVHHNKHLQIKVSQLRANNIYGLSSIQYFQDVETKQER